MLGCNTPNVTRQVVTTHKNKANVSKFRIIVGQRKLRASMGMKLAKYNRVPLTVSSKSNKQ